MSNELAATTTVQVQRLPFIDGVRGVAAFTVLAGHLIFMVPAVTQPSPGAATALDFVAWPFRFGQEMVFLFLLVSGFALYFSEISRRHRGRPATTLGQFAARRAWRIAPVYYCAVAFGLCTVAVEQRLILRPENEVGTQLTLGGLASHLVFGHNLNSDWLYQINGPLWSIAFEVQLYVLFPFVFYAMRRWNPFLVAAVVVAGVKVISLLHLGFPVFGLARWFIAGCLLAELHARGWRFPVRVTLPLGLAALLLGAARVPQLQSSEYRHDAVWLVAFALLLLAALRHPESTRNPFAWPLARWLGLRSYSLYALHWPVVVVLLYIAQRQGWGGWNAVALTLPVGVAVAVAISALSFRYIEGPSLRRVAAVGRTA